MAFNRENDVTKDRIGAFEVVFTVPDSLDPDGVQSGQINPQIVLSDGSIQTRSYNLLARLQDDAAGQQHLANLASLRDYIRTRLEAEVLPL